MADQSTPEPDDEPRPPATVWEAIRWDLLVFGLATAAFIVNAVSPDALSPALMLAFFVAMVWIAYRIHRKIQAFRNL